ncbi:MAG: hypothetical protein DMG13_03580 [Acidobacteria bacterium]|nr:MAG: hypothetical protein DMG13_03580 [Acidobacteriota bacterium]
MSRRFWISMGILAAAIALVSLSAVAGQAPASAPKTKAAKTAPAAKTWAPPKTPWGDPDLQGVWNDATSTPLQRPTELSGKDVLTDEEAEEFQEETAKNLSRDRRDGGPDADVNRAYNEHWMDARRLKITEDKRTSLIVDPPDGRIPPQVAFPPERQKTRAARADANARFNAGLPENYTDMSLPVRCIIRTDSPPYLPTIYNNDFHIFQSPGYVVIAPEMIHSARIIPLDGRPHLGKNLKQWLGDTRGHWEGNTLVIETTNFRTDDGVTFQGTNPETFRITERFTRVSPDTVNYEFTVEDPATWTKPWTARIPWSKIDPNEQMYEYACHEDNYDIVHFLTGARKREKNGETMPSRPVTGGVSQDR